MKKYKVKEVSLDDIEVLGLGRSEADRYFGEKYDHDGRRITGDEDERTGAEEFYEMGLSREGDMPSLDDILNE